MSSYSSLAQNRLRWNFGISLHTETDIMTCTIFLKKVIKPSYHYNSCIGTTHVIILLIIIIIIIKFLFDYFSVPIFSLQDFSSNDLRNQSALIMKCSCNYDNIGKSIIWTHLFSSWDKGKKVLYWNLVGLLKICFLHPWILPPNGEIEHISENPARIQCLAGNLLSWTRMLYTEIWKRECHYIT